LDFHLRHNSDATMAVRLQERQNPYGVVKMDGVKIIGIDEKPKEQFHVNGGIYVISPTAIKLLKKNTPCDMPEFFERLTYQNFDIYAYPMHEPWLDVGNHAEYLKANNSTDITSI
jgi:NDP-sugar pyrophosphorylase family protein